jgi:hypothetical protein
MIEPVVYYLLDTPLSGRIVAIAPMPLREEDKDPTWMEMSITVDDWTMIMDRGDFNQWFVSVDQTNNFHQLKLRTTKFNLPLPVVAPVFLPEEKPVEKSADQPAKQQVFDEIPMEQRKYRLLAATRSVPNPELLLDHHEGWIVLRKAFLPLYLGGTLDIWLSEEQNQTALIGNISLDQDKFGDGPIQLFPIQPIKTTLYYIDYRHRIKDVRPT